MTDQDFQRRSSYGPSSPQVGERGARTRMLIADAALRRFTTKGFHATSVDDIASAADTSRATLYQYFESKDAIFIELMIESGTALAAATSHIGRLGADAEGYESLHRWLESCCSVYDQYAPMFIEWANVNAANSSLRAQVVDYVDFHANRFGRALKEGHFADGEPEVAAILTIALFTRFNYIRHIYRPGLTDDQLLDSLAAAIQLYLFPDTPVAVLSGHRPETAHGAVSDERPPVTVMGPLASIPARGSIEAYDPFEGVSDQSATTVRALLDAASRVFAANGYNATNIDQIVSEAGLARGTFYRYFSEKVELLTALSQEASAAMVPLFDEFTHVANDRDPVALRSWLRRFLADQRRYAGVMRAWTEGFPIDPALMVGAAETVEAMSTAIASTFGPQRAYPLDRRAAGMLLSSLLENFPNEGRGGVHEPTDDQIVEAQAHFIERVLLPRESSVAR